MTVIKKMSRTFLAHTRAMLSRQDGASMVEYGLLIALIVMVAVIGVTAFGDAVFNQNSGIAGSMQTVLDNR